MTNKLEWVSEFPGKDGYYWISITYGSENKRYQYVQYVQADGSYYAPTPYDDENVENVKTLGRSTMFYGPIKEPNPPEVSNVWA